MTITLNLLECMLIQHDRSITDSCIHVKHVRLTRKNQKDIHFSYGKISSLCARKMNGFLRVYNNFFNGPTLNVFNSLW